MLSTGPLVLALEWSHCYHLGEPSRNADSCRGESCYDRSRLCTGPASHFQLLRGVAFDHSGELIERLRFEADVRGWAAADIATPYLQSRKPVQRPGPERSLVCGNGSKPTCWRIVTQWGAPCSGEAPPAASIESADYPIRTKFKEPGIMILAATTPAKIPKAREPMCRHPL
jgi:hypothetical protein